MSNLDDIRGARMSNWPIVLLRVYTGIFFLYFGGKKVMDGFGGSNTEGFLGAVSEGTFGFYKPIVEHVIVPASGVFSFLVAWGEVFLGIALIIGLATRYAAFAGAFMVANAKRASQDPRLAAWAYHRAAMAASGATEARPKS